MVRGERLARIHSPWPVRQVLTPRPFFPIGALGARVNTHTARDVDDFPLRLIESAV